MMMLAFEKTGQIEAGRIVRRARFERRSSLPLSAACVVANGVRETLSSALNTPVTLRLLEPAIPNERAWRAIAQGARLYAVRGPACDAAVVIRPRDALALASAVFGEAAGTDRPLSPVERHVVDRAAGTVAGSLSPICGREGLRVDPIEHLDGFLTYFELLLERPVNMRLGFAFSREPAERSGAARLDPGILLDVEAELRVEFARGQLDAGAFLDLRPGAIVPMMTRIGEPGRLNLGATLVARGECGAVGERSAIILHNSSVKKDS